MERSYLSLDFGSGKITAALCAYDDETSSLRVRHATTAECKAVNAGFVIDIEDAKRALTRIFAEISDYVSFNPTVIVGLRGSFLSFKRASGFQNVQSRNRVITSKDIEAAVANSVPKNLPEALEVIDVLAQVFSIDGKTGIQNPKGMEGFGLEVETFLTCALVTHSNNLNKVLQEAECHDYQATPTITALAETLLKPEEKQAGVMLLDIGAQHSSVILYYKGTIADAWEIPAGADLILQEVADVLQNDLPSARKVLSDYEYGSDDIIDGVIDEGASRLAKTLKKELLQSLSYVKYPPTNAVLTGGGAVSAVRNACKDAFNLRKARIATHEDLIADSEDLLGPTYTSALSLILYAMNRQTTQPAATRQRAPEDGFFDRMLEKLGLSELL